MPLQDTRRLWRRFRLRVNLQFIVQPRKGVEWLGVSLTRGIASGVQRDPTYHRGRCSDRQKPQKGVGGAEELFEWIWWRPLNKTFEGWFLVDIQKILNHISTDSKISVFWHVPEQGRALESTGCQKKRGAASWVGRSKVGRVHDEVLTFMWLMGGGEEEGAAFLLLANDFWVKRAREEEWV